MESNLLYPKVYKCSSCLKNTLTSIEMLNPTTDPRKIDT
jgi:hypothetical protein